jgi:hypothetical protein
MKHTPIQPRPLSLTIFGHHENLITIHNKNSLNCGLIKQIIILLIVFKNVKTKQAINISIELKIIYGMNLLLDYMWHTRFFAINFCLNSNGN